MPHINVTDSELFEAIKLNNQKAFNQLFERHWFKVYSVAYRYVKNEEDALEIAHDIFLNIWNKRQQLSINSFKSYVITAAGYHGIRKRQTTAKLAVQYVEDYDNLQHEALSSSQNQGECNIDEKEINETVETLLNNLPRRCREIYHMSRKENLSITEIAEKLGISKRTVENQLTTALKHLRTALKYYIILIVIASR
ncbi:RNA polymerase sigma-70 factor (ECF subfamily) [Mucilaginibacter gracilis]|uniref:RNA polymerase sigma-70 factor (ECF subfamily) n=1 Tax=Mucilaginibacter gracilis TaxID=423350 RepID=A0A495IWS3_9SPHI|nr:RNA polymerase sigma-70 factor [Mucilaginibacter gracilis]RKR80319.1 RNA polymerase sigma-70 factor (ECF subfamily) [Mucilaginibacter gracilis]